MEGPTIFIVSGGMGTSGEQIVRTALAQFPEAEVQVHVTAHVRQAAQLEEVVAQAAGSNSIIVHTLVNADLRQALIDLARQRQVEAIDLMGHLLTALSALLKQPPLGQPGLYRELHQTHFERVEAIEFTVKHDDGRNPHELGLAEIVLVGVSRTGKTPLSIYLSTWGWKVANVPLIKDIPPPEALFKIDPGRVVGLTVAPEELADHRRWRQRRLGLSGQTAYADLAQIVEEVQAARQVFRQGGFPVVDVTNKPIEESAREVIALVTRRAGLESD